MKAMPTMAAEEADVSFTRGERALLINMIAQAIRDLNDSAERDDALTWLISDAGYDEEWSFRWCCQNIGLSCAATEAKIVEMKRGCYKHGSMKRRNLGR